MIKRRDFLKLAGATSVSVLLDGVANAHATSAAQTLIVATNGSDEHPGTLDRPLATLHTAQRMARNLRADRPDLPVYVLVKEGIYFLASALTFDPEDGGSLFAPVVYAAFPGASVTLVGAKKLQCQWQARKKGKYICDLTATNTGPFDFTEMYVNGRREIRARYPNWNPDGSVESSCIYAVGAIPAGTSSPETHSDEDLRVRWQGPVGLKFDPATFSQKRWAKPEEAVVHLMPGGERREILRQLRTIDYDRNLAWFDTGNLSYPQPADSPFTIDNQTLFFVENVYEEMNAPREWYLSRESGTLYYLPDEQTNMETALIEVPLHGTLVRFNGLPENHIPHLLVEGFSINSAGI